VQGVRSKAVERERRQGTYDVRIDAVEDGQACPGDQLVGQCLSGLGLGLLEVVDHVVEDVLESELHVLVQVDARESGFVVELAWLGKALDGIAMGQGLIGHGRILSGSRGRHVDELSER
jgi:hypothetical protein